MYGYVCMIDMLIYSCIYIVVWYVKKDPTHFQGLDLGSDITSAGDYQAGALKKRGIWDSWYLDIWYLVQNYWQSIDPKKLDPIGVCSIFNSDSIGRSITGIWLILCCGFGVCPHKTLARNCLPSKMPLETVKPWLWSRAKSTMFELSAQCIWGLYPVSWKSNLRACRFLILKH